MLHHESQEQPATTPAAQIRVTSEELTEAINALQASKDEAARRLAGTVPIGEVVKELNLEATPEEVWAQVQKQRQSAAEKAAEKAAAEKAVADRAASEEAAYAPQEAFRRAAREARNAAEQARLAAQVGAQAYSGAQVYMRPRQRRRGKWWAILGIGFAVYGITHGNLLHSHTAQITQRAVISGDNQTLTSGTLGKNVEVAGDGDTLILQGDCPTLTITGDGNNIRIEGAVSRVIADGDGNSVVYTRGSAPALQGKGDGNRIGPNVP